MMNKLQKVLLTILTFISAIMIPMTAYAANGKCNINVTYSTYVTPSDSDKFEITIKDSKENEQTFEIDAYSLANASGSIELPTGVYSITDLKYIGEGDLDWYGFSTPNFFIVAEDDSSKAIEIAIGYDQIMTMYDEIGQDTILMFQRGHKLIGLKGLANNNESMEITDRTENPGNDYDLHNGKIVGYDYEEGEIEEDPDLSEMAEMAIKSEKDTEEEETIEQIAQESEEELTEGKEAVKTEEKANNNAHKKSILTRVAILGMLVIIVGILLLVLKKKGKI